MKKRKKLKKELAEMGIELKEDNTFVNQYGVKFTLDEYKEYKKQVRLVNEKRQQQLAETDNLPLMQGNEKLGDMSLRDRREMLRKESPFLIKERKTSTINTFVSKLGYERNVEGLQEVIDNGTKRKLQIYRENLIQGGRNIGLYQNNGKSKYIENAINTLPIELFEKAFVNNELFDMDYMYGLENEADRLDEMLQEQIDTIKPIMDKYKKDLQAKKQAEIARQKERERLENERKQKKIQERETAIRLHQRKSKQAKRKKKRR